MSRAAETKLREAVEGTEKLCTRCEEWWPADREFFYSDPSSVGGLFYCCKACYAEWFRNRPKRQPSAPPNKLEASR